MLRSIKLPSICTNSLLFKTNLLRQVPVYNKSTPLLLFPPNVKYFVRNCTALPSTKTKHAPKKGNWKARNQSNILKNLFPHEERVVNAYCIANSFKFRELYEHLNSQWPNVTTHEESFKVIIRPHRQLGTIFFFEGGSVVFWGTPHSDIERTLNSIQPFLNEPLKKPTKEQLYFHYGEENSMDKDALYIARGTADDILDSKLVFSYGLHQSVKLRDFEEKIEAEVWEIKNFPDLLINRSPSFLDRTYRRAVRERTQYVLRIQANLNLYSDTAHALRNTYELDRAYDLILSNLELKERMEVLNKRMEYSYELIEALGDGLADQNEFRIVWIIIVLIGMSIVVGIVRHAYVGHKPRKSKKKKVVASEEVVPNT